MKAKSLLILSSISVFLGIGYVAFAYTPFGKKVLINWLLKKWEQAVIKKKKPYEEPMPNGQVKVYPYNEIEIKKKLEELSFDDLTLLTHFTWVFPILPKDEELTPKKEQRFKKFMEKMMASEKIRKAQFKPLWGIVFPS